MDLWYESYRFVEERPLDDEERLMLGKAVVSPAAYASLFALASALTLLGLIAFTLSSLHLVASMEALIVLGFLGFAVALFLRNVLTKSLEARRDLQDGNVLILERIAPVAEADTEAQVGKEQASGGNRPFESFEGAESIEVLPGSGRVVRVDNKPLAKPDRISPVESASLETRERPLESTRMFGLEEIEELEQRIADEKGVSWGWIAVWFAFLLFGAILLANHMLGFGFWIWWPASLIAVWYTTKTRTEASTYRTILRKAVDNGSVEILDHETGWQERLPNSNWPWTLNGWPSRWRRS